VVLLTSLLVLKVSQSFILYTHIHIVINNAYISLITYFECKLCQMVSMGRRRFGTDFQLMFRILKALLFLGFLSVMTILFVVFKLTLTDLSASVLAFLPTGWAILLVNSHQNPLQNHSIGICIMFLEKTNGNFSQIGQVLRSPIKALGVWDSVKELGRAYENIMGLVIFAPIAVLSWFPIVSEFQARLLFNQAFSRGLQISMILAGRKDKATSSHK